ncbi:Dyp-type peroxidase [Thermomonospora catenispora]|uniref:Dyp-type peroxidase n=1 Tax=Thermomonospora catenispora TaxID=2493090 RepID=UPI00111D4FFB|nr:Dyp-type peroxidase [Thermomonospora catenispora]TNY36294.1 Dyp-type peroxidase [Thermomonospora catenispora]
MTPSRHRLSRRGLLTGGAAAAAAGALAACSDERAADPRPSAAPTAGSAVEPFHGPHQAGIATLPQAHAVFLGLDLRKGTGRTELARLMRLLTDDARRLTQGRPALADPEPELASPPSRLTFTFGFGPGLFEAAGLERLRPEGVRPLPSFKVDRLEDRWSGGDLLVQICCDDPITLAHALRVTVKDARAFARVRWVQRGFRRSPGVEAGWAAQRNLMGQLDGTVNPVPGTADFDRAVWVQDGPEWLRGGTTLVLRRIRMELEKWDEVDPAGKEFAVGRRLGSGAPLTGRREHDEPDFEAVDSAGLPVIAENAHIRLARVGSPRLRMLRRPYNYDEGPTADGRSDAGLLFAAYQADVDRQFVPVQRRLDEGGDLLNLWTTPIGSAVFAVPPGCGEGGWIGQGLLG